MMQDCTHIRSLEGSQTLLTWAGETATETTEKEAPAINEITPDTRLKDLLKQYPELRKRLPEIAPEFKMLGTPLGKIMAAKATVRMMSERSGVALDRLIEEIKSRL